MNWTEFFTSLFNNADKVFGGIVLLLGAYWSWKAKTAAVTGVAQNADIAKAQDDTLSTVEDGHAKILKALEPTKPVTRTKAKTK